MLAQVFWRTAAYAERINRAVADAELGSWRCREVGWR